jgi:murein L,D-transpeptidase YafK
LFSFNSFRVCTYGFGGLGPKIRQGDGKAPEGFYRVAPEQMNPASNFHLAFNLGYPNRFDRHYGRTGSALMVHGSCVSIGCYAMTDDGIEEIYALADAAFRNGRRPSRSISSPFG